MKDLRTYILETKKISSIDNHIQEGFKLGKNKVKKEEENDFVDLDLPSGTLWCKYNIGATCKDDAKSWYGDYFMWGDTEPANSKTCYWDNYKYANGKFNKLTKYCPTDKTDFWDGKGNPDNKLTLDLKDDMAYANTDGDCRLPSTKSIYELIKCTTNKWVENYDDIQGLNGKLFTSHTNGVTLFIPAAGYRHGNVYDSVGSALYIWSSGFYPAYPNSVYRLYSNRDSMGVCDWDNRYNGYSVRAIKNKK